MNDKATADEAEVLRLHGKEYAELYQKKNQRRVTRLIPLINESSFGVVADIGCGTGMLLDALEGKFSHYHGVDLSPDMLAYARQRQMPGAHSKVSWHQEDIVSFLNSRPDTFDNVFALDFSEHVNDDNWVRILKGVATSLKPGGSFYMHTPNREYIIELLKHHGILKQFPEHIAVRDRAENSRLLQAAGFESISCKFLSHYEIRQKPLALLSHLPLIGRYFNARLFMRAQKAPATSP